MAYTNAYAEREWDYKRSQILPGVSESQAVPYRHGNVDDTNTPLDSPNNSLPQPKQTNAAVVGNPNPTNSGNTKLIKMETGNSYD